MQAAAPAGGAHKQAAASMDRQRRCHTCPCSAAIDRPPVSYCSMRAAAHVSDTDALQGRVWALQDRAPFLCAPCRLRLDLMSPRGSLSPIESEHAPRPSGRGQPLTSGISSWPSELAWPPSP